MENGPTIFILVHRAQSGDRAAFEELVDRHRARLNAFVRSRLGEHLRHKVEVEDICQETILRSLRSLKEFSCESEDSFFRWIAGIAANVFHELARRDRREPLDSSPFDVFSGSPSPSKVLRREERLDRLQEALDKLKPEYRQVILLVRIEKLSFSETARRMNRSQEAVRSLLWRALRSLKEAFGDTESMGLPPGPLRNGGRSDDQ